ncbi:glycosyltransferase [Sphingobacterium faecium]|uniref:glycosyltransferase n=1 Tax=Sphingobacterium faecium TaxID=34087 RepID=UPI00320A37C0
MNNFSPNTNDILFSQLEILPSIQSSIVIPVKNEETYIVKTLNSFAQQVDILGEPLPVDQFEILILANNCSDNSVAYIKDFQTKHPDLNIYLEEITLPSAQANIGYIRRKLMECAYLRLAKNGGGIIVTTDGDTIVAQDWIAQTYWEIENGAECVGGRILLADDELEGLDEYTRLHHFKDEKYHLLIAELEARIINSSFDPLPRHHQHFNGSFAITTDCYYRSGGVPVVNQLEDCAFFERLESVDAKIRHSWKVKVYTSARCIGRTEIGLSYQLNEWKNLGKQVDEYFVESCPSIINRLTIKKNLMILWEIKERPDFDFYQEVGKIALEMALNDEMYETFKNSRYFGEWYEKIIKSKQVNGQEEFPAVHIDKAIKDLMIKLKEYAHHNLPQTSIL